MATRLRSRSSSLKNLPPESPGSASSDVHGVGLVVSGSNARPAGSGHWTINDKDRLAAPKRPRQTVQLKHLKGTGASPNSGSQQSSIGAAWTDPLSNDHLTDCRQQQPQAEQMGHPRAGALTSRAPLVAQRKDDVHAGQLPGGRSPSSGNRPRGEKLSSTAPATLCGRPPPVPSKSVASDTAACLVHEGGGSDKHSSEDLPSKGRAAASSRPPLGATASTGGPGASASSARAMTTTEQVELKHAKPMGTAVPDSDGVIYRPLTGAPPTPLPRGTHRLLFRPGSSAGTSRASTPNAAVPLELSGSAVAAPRPPSNISLSEAEPPPAVPRIAWSEGAAGGQEVSGPEPDVWDLATQLRRELLAVHLSQKDTGELGESSMEAGASRGNASPGKHQWSLSTPDARKSLEDMERCLAQVWQRTESSRRELDQYLDDLHAKTFEPPPALEDAPASDEPLVAIPADFDDIVDLNAQFAGAQRRQSRQQAAASGSGSKPVDNGPAEGAPSGFKLPSFLEKYFLEDKAVEQLPHLQLQDKEDKAKPKEETEFERGLRQIAKLDGLLAKREAAGNARLRAAKVEFEAVQERFRKEVEETKQNKVAVLQKLKEKGLVCGSTPGLKDRNSGRSSQAAASGSCGSANDNHSTKLAMVEPSGLPTLASHASMDWSGWTSTAVLEELEAPAPQSATASDGGDHPNGSAEVDEGTFLLTSMTGHLGNLAAPRRRLAASKAEAATSRNSRSPVAALALATIQEAEGASPDSSALICVEPGEELQEVEAEEEVDPKAGDAEPYADAESVEAIRRIDEQLQRLVPESEWEAKSISLPSGSDAGDGGRARSVWSTDRTLALPGEAVLQDHAKQREIVEQREAIEDRLRALQLENARPPDAEALKPDVLRQLLMQAVQESAPLQSKDKVMALTMQGLNSSVDVSSAPNEGGAVAEQAALVLAGAPHFSLPENAKLSQARQLLNKLNGYDLEWEETQEEAHCVWQELEQDARALEDTAPPGDDSGAMSAPRALEDTEYPDYPSKLDGISDGPTKLELELDPYKVRLSEMAEQIAAFTERSGPSDKLLQSVGESGTKTTVGSGTKRCGDLPTLSLATAMEPTADDGDLSSISDYGESTEFTFAGPSCINTGPSTDLLRALDIELPPDNAEWDDEELERVVRMMDAHYGDEPPPMNFEEPAFPDALADN